MVALVCKSCHSFDKGGGGGTGPNLWDIVGQKYAHQAGFAYSAAMKAKGGSWTFDELNKFLAGPRNYIPSTKMTFAGLNSENQRADIIAYLRMLSDNPLPLPKVPNTTAGPAGSKPNEQAPAQKKGS